MTATPDQLFRALDDFITPLMGVREGKAMDRLIELDLSFSQVRVLFVLMHHGRPVAIHEIAEPVRLSLAATGRNVDQLVQQGLVERREDPTDRRVKLVSLSEAGRAVVAGHLEAKRDVVRDFTRRLDGPLRTDLYESLRAVLADGALHTNENNCQETS